MYKAKMRCVALLIIMLSMVSCGQNRPEQNDTEQNTSEVTEEMTPNTITTTAVSNEETEPVDLHYLVSEELVTARCISIP